MNISRGLTSLFATTLLGLIAVPMCAYAAPVIPTIVVANLANSPNSVYATIKSTDYEMKETAASQAVKWAYVKDPKGLMALQGKKVFIQFADGVTELWWVWNYASDLCVRPVDDPTGATGAAYIAVDLGSGYSSVVSGYYQYWDVVSGDGTSMTWGIDFIATGYTEYHYSTFILRQLL